MERRNFRIEDRLRSFAKLITGNFSLKVVFEGDKAFLDEERMQIPPVQNTPQALSRAKFYISHECGHALFSDFAVMEEASREDSRLPRILNSLEDARVERMMAERFPGLRRIMWENIQEIISEWNITGMPLHTQLIYGMYLMGKGLDVSILSGDAQIILSLLKEDILKAALSDEPYPVLESARRILRKIDELVGKTEKHDIDARPSEDTGDEGKRENEKPGVAVNASEEKTNNTNTVSDDGIQLPKEVREELGRSDLSCDSISDLIKSHFDKVRLPDDYDGMRGLEHLKDENNDEEETIHIPPEGPLEDYHKILNPILRECNFLSGELERITSQRRRKKRHMAFKRGERRGILDTKTLWRIAEGEDKVFKRRIKGEGKSLTVDPDSLAIFILIDESWSMSEMGRIKEAQKALIILAEALDNLQIPFAITGYTTTRNELLRFSYKEFHEDFRKVRTRLLQIRARHGTYTAEHIPFALRRLERRKERKKILMVITDSEDIESEYRLKRAMDKAKEKGIEVIGVGIQTDLMAEYYDRFIQIERIESFAKELLNLLKRVLTEQHLKTRGTG